VNTFDLDAPIELPPLPFFAYDKVIIAFSGGKDSLACLLYVLFVLCIPAEKVELWHHCVDGHTVPGIDDERPLMDWPCTLAYCRAVAKAFGVPLYLSWKSGGFEQEMLRDDEETAPCFFETPDGLRKAGGNSGKRGTRRKFPQTSSDLSTRWCSSYLKISPSTTALCNDSRFLGINTLFITGERAEESTARASYLQNEIHRADPRKSPPQYSKHIEWLIVRSHDADFRETVAFLGYVSVIRRWYAKKQRHIDHWRPVLRWKVKQIWAIIKFFLVNPHPAYRLGWSRLSCMCCIFNPKEMWATLLKIARDYINRIYNYEIEFDSTIRPPKKNGVTKEDVISLATSTLPLDVDPKDVAAAMSREFNEPVILEEGEWVLPSGAFSSLNPGPT